MLFYIVFYRVVNKSADFVEINVKNCSFCGTVGKSHDKLEKARGTCWLFEVDCKARLWQICFSSRTFWNSTMYVVQIIKRSKNVAIVLLKIILDNWVARCDKLFRYCQLTLDGGIWFVDVAKMPTVGIINVIFYRIPSTLNWVVNMFTYVIRVHNLMEK